MLAGYVIFPLAFAPTLLFNGDDPRNLLLIEADDGLNDLMRGIGALFYSDAVRPGRDPLGATATGARTASSACS